MGTTPMCRGLCCGTRRRSCWTGTRTGWWPRTSSSPPMRPFVSRRHGAVRRSAPSGWPTAKRASDAGRRPPAAFGRPPSATSPMRTSTSPWPASSRSPASTPTTTSRAGRRSSTKRSRSCAPRTSSWRRPSTGCGSTSTTWTGSRSGWRSVGAYRCYWNTTSLYSCGKRRRKCVTRWSALSGACMPTTLSCPWGRTVTWERTRSVACFVRWPAWPRRTPSSASLSWNRW
mmetsp:Transcript_55443/g.98764  ORF Transcript_55443/g.98764 Transcript_55443/m.98764 type:complete len:229 (-) Transcript_55443:283-969(-)